MKVIETMAINFAKTSQTTAAQLRGKARAEVDAEYAEQEREIAQQREADIEALRQAQAQAQSEQDARTREQVALQQSLDDKMIQQERDIEALREVDAQRVAVQVEQAQLAAQESAKRAERERGTHPQFGA